MPSCLIIGAGFSGLSAAVKLSQKGFKVTVVEASPKPGGRAYSFQDKETGTIIDNGQHILMGCYRYTLDFLKLIKARDKILIQEKLKVVFVKKGFEKFILETGFGFYPLNLTLGILFYNAITFSERIKVIKLFIKLFFINTNKLENLSVREWLAKEGQNKNIQKCLWEIIAVGALNTNLDSASAKIFADILKEIFLKGNFNTKIIIPSAGLSEIYCNQAIDFIKSKNGEIKFSEEVLEFIIKDEKNVSVKTDKNIYENFDYLISAMPPFALERLLPEVVKDLPVKYSSILTVHLWLKENNLKEKFYSLIDSKIHWVFNHNELITTVVSDADYLIEKSKEELFELTVEELEKYFSIKKENISSYKIIKEKRATFVPSKEFLIKRPNPETEIKNLILAGDWVQTGLPSTIESAVKSGYMAAEKIVFI